MIVDDFAAIAAELGKFAPSRIVSGRSCERCELNGDRVKIGVKRESSRTMYHFDGEIGSADDPNRPVWLCRLCAAEHHAEWNATWAEYYAGLL